MRDGNIPLAYADADSDAVFGCPVLDTFSRAGFFA
jgi:hypothetical protein